jgi:hypothetical protein
MTQVAMLRIIHTRRFWRADNQPWNANNSPECPKYSKQHSLLTNNLNVCFCPLNWGFNLPDKTLIEILDITQMQMLHFMAVN